MEAEVDFFNSKAVSLKGHPNTETGFLRVFSGFSCFSPYP